MSSSFSGPQALYEKNLISNVIKTAHRKSEIEVA